MSRCFECKGKMEKKVLYEKLWGQKVWAEWHVCKKCGERAIDLKEYQRVYDLLRPPLSKRISLLLSYPVEALRKIAW